MMITLPVELFSSKNHKQIRLNKLTKKRYVGKSDAALKSEKDMLKILPFFRHKFGQMIKDKIRPYHISFKIYRKTRARFDYVNIVQLLLDCMVKDRWLKDDNANEIIPVFLLYEVDGKNSRVEIDII